MSPERERPSTCHLVRRRTTPCRLRSRPAETAVDRHRPFCRGLRKRLNHDLRWFRSRWSGMRPDGRQATSRIGFREHRLGDWDRRAMRRPPSASPRDRRHWRRRSRATIAHHATNPVAIGCPGLSTVLSQVWVPADGFTKMSYDPWRSVRKAICSPSGDHTGITIDRSGLS